jgi:excisionase family DNA binding protein
VKDIITPSQVASLLQIHVKTVYRLAEDGRIPGNKIGRSWRFVRQDLLDLVSNKQSKGAGNGKSGVHKRQSRHGGSMGD